MDNSNSNTAAGRCEVRESKHSIWTTALPGIYEHLQQYKWPMVHGTNITPGWVVRGYMYVPGIMLMFLYCHKCWLIFLICWQLMLARGQQRRGDNQRPIPTPLLTFLRTAVPFWGRTTWIWLVCPQTGTAVLKGLITTAQGQTSTRKNNANINKQNVLKTTTATEQQHNQQDQSIAAERIINQYVHLYCSE